MKEFILGALTMAVLGVTSANAVMYNPRILGRLTASDEMGNNLEFAPLTRENFFEANRDGIWVEYVNSAGNTIRTTLGVCEIGSGNCITNLSAASIDNAFISLMCNNLHPDSDKSGILKALIKNELDFD